MVVCLVNKSANFLLAFLLHVFLEVSSCESCAGKLQFSARPHHTMKSHFIPAFQGQALLRCAPLPRSFRHLCDRQATAGWAGYSVEFRAQLPSGKEARKLQNSRSMHATLQSKAATSSAKARNADDSAVAVIVGGSRGIGLAMVTDLLSRFNGRIFATGRNPDNATGLQEVLAEAAGRVTPISMDVTDEESVAAAAAIVRDLSGARVDLLINTAGILHDTSESSSQGRVPERQLKDVTEDWLMYNFKVNTMGPIFVAKHFQGMMETKGPRAGKVHISRRTGVGYVHAAAS